MTTRVDAHISNTLNAKRIRLSTLRATGLVLWSVLVIVQWLSWSGKQDYITTFLAIAGGIIGTVCFLRQNLLAAYPISTSMMLGYVSYYFLLPPLATVLEGKPLTYNLDHPELVLFHALVSLLLLICAHTFYRNWHPLKGLRWFISRKIYQPFGFFRPPTNLHLLVMGSIGLMAMGVEVFIVGVYQGEAVGIINKLMQGLYPLAYLPYVIMVRKLIDQDSGFDRKWLLILFGYTILIAIVSLGRNSRAALYMGFASIILAYFYGMVIGFYKVNLGRLLVTLLVVIATSGPITDLAISIVVIRGTRTDISARDLVLETIKVFQDKKTLKLYRTYAAQIGSAWDEGYVENPFMARLSNLKYADNSINFALSMSGSTREYMREIEIQRIWANFPRPLIETLGLPVDKDFIGAGSSGDFMLYAVTGYTYVLGGYRTGSIFGNGYALFGWLYPFVFALLLLLIFPLADALTSRTAIARMNPSKCEWAPTLSPMAIIGFYSLFFYLTSAATGSESMSDLVSYLLRGWIQILFVYVLAYWIAYIPVKMNGRKHVSP